MDKPHVIYVAISAYTVCHASTNFTSLLITLSKQAQISLYSCILHFAYCVIPDMLISNADLCCVFHVMLPLKLKKMAIIHPTPIKVGMNLEGYSLSQG